MTRVDTDQLHVALNGSPNNDSVVELAPLANGVQGRINIGRGNPHAHWMSHDGHTMVTPNAFSADSTQYDFLTNIPTIRQAGNLPIATGMTPDSSKYYVANLLDSSLTVISTTNGPIGSIDLIKGYNAVNGNITGTEFGGALPIQTPVAPDGKSMVTANTLTGTIAIVDTRHLVNNLPNPNEDKVVAMLPCDPGCHGVQYGAKQGGGYYAYVSSKFSNALIVVDPDINGDGDPKDADIVGRILLAGPAASDDAVTGLAGMGGQGILTIPVVYNGWVQNLPQNWACKLSGPQLNPIGAAVAPPTCP
jgi:DNA-binding beta-propeller fold protein YncE